MRRSTIVVSAVALVAAAGTALGVLVGAPDAHNARGGTQTTSAIATPPPPVSDRALRALPESDYSAVIPGLIGFDETVERATVARPARDLPLFGEDRRTPVARLAARDFLDEPTTVVIVRRAGPWALVLTPSRQVLPSRAGISRTAPSTAPAQTAAWTAADLLGPTTTTGDRIEISVGRQELRIRDAADSITARFPAAVGATDTPTPTGITGYLEQRYLDPTQGTGDHPIQLTSLHATAADEPFGGSDGGLIGLHWNPTTSGAVSHGCVRLSADAVRAVDALPLGSLVTITA